MTEVHVLSAVRTPIGRYGGALGPVRPDDLAATVLQAALDGVPGLSADLVDDVILGAVNQAGEDNRNVARMAVLLAGWPVTVPGYTVNRLCGSGLQAVNDGVALIAAGMADVVVVGGTESMTRAPFVVPKPDRAFSRRLESYDSTLGWRMVNPRMPAEWTISMGECAELLADRYGIGREEQDAFAVESHRRALVAWDEGAFDLETVPVETPEGDKFDRDESLRPDTSVEKLGRLKPAFRHDGTVTAGNSCPVNDGAAALVLASADMARSLEAEPLATVRGAAVAAVSPPDFGVGPVPAIHRLLERSGTRPTDLAQVELNEAFAVQVLACNRELGFDRDRLNPLGGAIALGHPVGCSGARLVATLIHSLRRRGGGLGVASLCIGIGQGIATLFAV